MTDPANGILATIAAFYAARLDEDEAAAREACDRDSGEWFVGRKWNVYRAEDLTPHDDEDSHELVVEGNVLSQSEHIARHDPVRVLREVEAKRAFLKLYMDAVAKHDQYEAQLKTDFYGVNPLIKAGRAAVVGALGGALMELAAVYAQHPDYQKGWES